MLFQEGQFNQGAKRPTPLLPGNATSSTSKKVLWRDKDILLTWRSVTKAVRCFPHSFCRTHCISHRLGIHAPGAVSKDFERVSMPLCLYFCTACFFCVSKEFERVLLRKHKFPWHDGICSYWGTFSACPGKRAEELGEYLLYECSLAMPHTHPSTGKRLPE